MTIVTGRAEGGGAKQPVCCGLIEPVKVGFDRGRGGGGGGYVPTRVL